MKRTHTLLAVCALVAVAVTASVATAETQKKKQKRGNSDPSRTGKRFKARGAGDQALAKKLGVTVAQLAAAMKSARQSVGPPDPSSRGDAESRDAHCTKLTDAIAQELELPGDAYRTAAKDVAKAQIAKDVKAGRLTQSRADEITGKIDASNCAPPLRLGGCGGPGGHGNPGVHRGPGGHGGPRGPGANDNAGGSHPIPQ